MTRRSFGAICAALLIGPFLICCGGGDLALPPTIAEVGQPPEVALLGDAPTPLGLLETVTLEWKSDTDCAYWIERGGDGDPGTGEILEEGILDAEAVAAFEVSAAELPEREALSFWIYARNSDEEVGRLEIVLERASPTHISWPESPGDVVVLSDGSRAYVARRFGHELDIVELDPASPDYLEIVGAIEVELRPWRLAITPDGSRIYVSNAVAPGAIAVVETGSEELAETIQGVGIPGPVAFSPEGKLGYFTDFDRRVRLLDTDRASASLHSIVQQVHIHTALLSGAIAVSPDASRAVVNWSGATIHGCDLFEIDPADGRLRGLLASPIAVGDGAAGDVVVDSGSAFGYAASTAPDGALIRFELATGSVTAAVTLEELTSGDADTIDATIGGQRIADLQVGLVLTNDDAHLFAVGPNGDSVKLYRAESLEELARVEIGGGAADIVITPDGTRALVTRSGIEPELVVVPLR